MRDIKNNSHRIPNFLSPLAIKELLQSLNSDKVSRFSFSQNYLNKFILFLKKKIFILKLAILSIINLIKDFLNGLHIIFLNIKKV